MNIASILRHWFTLAATLLTGWLIASLALTPDQQTELTKALGDLVGPLVIIGTLVVTAVWRIALAWIGKVLRTGSGELENSGPSGGAGLLLMIGTMAVLGGLPSCSSLSGLPIKATVQLEEGALSYSSKGGLEMEYRPGYGQMPDHYRNTPSIDRRSSK
jgi:hypothetical protein